MSASSWPRRPWVIASIALNLFLIGGIAGAAWRWWSEHAPDAQAVTQNATPPRAARALRLAADELSPARRQAFREGLRELRRDSADLAQTSREGRAAVARLWVAPDFDRSAVAATLSRVRAADVELRDRVESYVVGFAATLDPDERAVFLRGLARQGGLRLPPPEPRP